MSKTNSSKMSKKTLSNTVSAVSEWIASNVPDGDLKKSFESKQSELQKVLVHNMKEKQKKEKDPNAPKKLNLDIFYFAMIIEKKSRKKILVFLLNMLFKNWVNYGKMLQMIRKNNITI